MSSKIVPLLPRHTVYVEPFCGGAAVFFAKPWPPVKNNNHYCEVLNDIDSRIVNLYRVVQDPVLGPEFVRRAAMPYSRELFLEAKTKLYLSGVDGATAYWTVIQQSFCNTMKGWGTRIYNQNGAATWANKVDHLPEYLDRMMGVHIEHDDAIAVIKRWDSPQTLFYCDPPYPNTDQDPYTKYTDLYTQEHFETLCATLDGCQGSFVLSGYDNPAPRDHWEKFTFETTSSAAGGGRICSQKDRTKATTKGEKEKRTEVVWRVDRSDTARVEVQKIWEKWGWEKGQPMPAKLK